MSALLAAPRPACVAVRLLEAIPELADAVPAGQRPAAVRTVTAPLQTFAKGPMAEPLTATAVRPFALVVLDGVVLRTTVLSDRPSAQLLGEGDVLELPGAFGETSSLTTCDGAQVAILDDRFRRHAQRWPWLHDGLRREMARQLWATSRHLAILHLPRVEDRLVAVLRELAERWGRVTPDGLAVDLPLTHELLARLVGSRRPTVTLAVGDLCEAGTLARRRDGTWLLPDSRGAGRATVGRGRRQRPAGP